MRLYFIRHGQSENNALWDETGSNNGRSEDPELTALGHRQAQLLADFVAQKDAEARADGAHGERRRDYFGITHLYSSLMVRAVATAAYLSRVLNLPLVGWPEIHELGGIYLEGEEGEEAPPKPGKARSYFMENYQGIVLPETVTDAGWWNRPFEPFEERRLRAEKVVEDLLARHGNTDDRVAIVSHGAFYMELTRILFNIQEPNCWYLMYNTAISRFEFRDNGEVVLMYHNRTDHLPDALLT